MREFYELCEKILFSETQAEVLGHASVALALGSQMVARAKSRCEYGAVADITVYMEWITLSCSRPGWEHDSVPMSFPFDRYSSPYSSIYDALAAPRRPVSSLDYKHRAATELDETWLPSVPGHAYRV